MPAYNSHTCFVPCRPLPNVPPSNGIHPTTLRPTAIAVCVPLLVITGIFVGVRTAEALRKDRRLKLDDYTCLVALFFAIPDIVFFIISATTNRRDHEYPLCAPDLNPARIIEYCPPGTRDNLICFTTPYWEKINSLGAVFSTTTWLFGTLALCALYLRLFDSVRWLRYTIWVVIVLSTSCNIAALVLLAIFYFPHGKQEHWGPTIAIRTWHTVVFQQVQMCVQIFCSILFVIVPIQPIVSTMLPAYKKISTLSVFATSLIVAVATSFRFFYLRSIGLDSQSHGPKHRIVDPAWKTGHLYLMTEVEELLIILVSCVAGCVSAWRHVFRTTRVYTQIKSWIIRLREYFGFAKQQNPSQNDVFDSAAFKPNLNVIEDGNDDV